MKESQLMNYNFIVPDVFWKDFLTEMLLLIGAFSLPIVAYIIGIGFQRSGSITVILSLGVEIYLLNKMTTKHLLNSARAKSGDDPIVISSHYKILAFLSFGVAIFGTAIWGFGDLMV